MFFKESWSRSYLLADVVDIPPGGDHVLGPLLLLNQLLFVGDQLLQGSAGKEKRLEIFGSVCWVCV